MYVLNTLQPGVQLTPLDKITTEHVFSHKEQKSFPKIPVGYLIIVT